MKKEMIPLTKENKSYKKQEACHIRQKDKNQKIMIKMMKTVLVEKRLKITVIIQKNLEEPLIANATKIIKFQKTFQ